MLAFLALLLVSTLFGGMTLYSFGFAPLVFRAMPAEAAGRFLRSAFPFYYLFIIVTAGAAGAALALRDLPSAGLMIAIGLVAVYARQGLMPQINAARDRQLNGDVAAKARFGRLHGLSVGLNMIQLLAAAYVLYRFL